MECTPTYWKFARAERQIAVSNMYMTRSTSWFSAISLFLLSFSALAIPVKAQAPATPDTLCDALCFLARPETQLFKQGEPVIVVLSIYTRSAKPIFVSRLTDGEFVKLSVIGPDGKEVRRQGNGRPSRPYFSSDFAVLGTYQEISAKSVISLKDGAGFVFDKPGEYFVTAEYSLGPPGPLAPFAGEAKIPTNSFRSTKAGFCIDACIREPLPVRSNTSQAALDAVILFYTNITKYQPIGIPGGRAEKALWPLLGKRLVQELDSLRACDDDYYRRYGEFLRANHYKPATPWLENGLFSGSNEAAGPMKFWILDSRAIGDNRVDVHLGFKISQGQDEHYEGVVTVIPENNRWVVDDFVSLGGNDELLRLSDGYRECKDGQWVGEIPF